MADGPPSSVSVAERLELLRQRRRAWSLLEWYEEHDVPMPGSCQAYELVGGVFAKTTNIELGNHGSRHFVATWLPSKTDLGRSLTRPDIGIPTRDFAIDPSQDLVIFVKSDEDVK